jgi:hyaluronan synthase
VTVRDEAGATPRRHTDNGERTALLNSRLIAWVSAVTSAALVVGFHQATWHGHWSVASVFFVAVSGMVVFILVLAAKGRPLRVLPVAQGKVVALVPAYNESDEMLHACISSMLDGTRPPDVIHVIDDGSAKPATRFEHPKVIWHRTENQGKRAAQIHALEHELDADYILTVDSDSIVDVCALEELLRAMSAPDVYAATGTCLVRNRTQNWLSRLTDLEFVTGNFVMRRARSYLGAVAPTTGALSLYRGDVVISNRKDYLTSGTYGDDRRLTHYSLLRGRVVVCDTAIVETEVPTKLKAMYRQRVRWSKGYVTYLPWELANLSGAALLLRVWSTVLIGVMPVVLIAGFVITPLTTHRFYWMAWAYWVLLLYSQTLTYAVGRPRMSAPQRWLTWLIGTPFLLVLQFAVLRPALFNAILRVRNDSWVTRDIQPAIRAAMRGDTVLPLTGG